MDNFEYDVFISHAKEDKNDFVEPLAEKLRDFGVKVWYDKFTLGVGDSLRDSIERGLSSSRYGAVIFSPNFMSKHWTKAELNGLFTREMAGQKVILPIWHNISSTEMRVAFPIQADKVALRSSDGIQAVARALMQIVRPELLEVETQRNSAFGSAESFIDMAQERHPGYAFTLHSGVQNTATGPGTIASIRNRTNRIDISISNPELIKEKPKLTIHFSEEGARKADELYRTGKPQIWNIGELLKIGGTIPMMPQEDASASSVMVASPNLKHVPPRFLRLEVGSPPITLQHMEMNLIRKGAEEAEVVLRQKTSPLEIGIVFSIDDSRRVEVTFSWDFPGHTCSACEKIIEIVDRLRKGDSLCLLDLETDKYILETPALADGLGDDPFPPELRRILRITAEAEKLFGITINFRFDPSQDDLESLFHLDCLLNGREYGRNLSVPITLTKQDGAVEQGVSLFLSGAPMRLFMAATNYPGYFPLFGTQIPAPAWGLFTDECVIEDPNEARERFEKAPVGELLSFTATGKAPTFIRWKSDTNSLLGISGNDSPTSN